VRISAVVHVADCVAFADEPGESEATRADFERNGGRAGLGYYDFLLERFCPDVDPEAARRIFD
jgi:hypothetical protein